MSFQQTRRKRISRKDKKKFASNYKSLLRLMNRHMVLKNSCSSNFFWTIRSHFWPPWWKIVPQCPSYFHPKSKNKTKRMSLLQKNLTRYSRLVKWTFDNPTQKRSQNSEMASPAIETQISTIQKNWVFSKKLIQVVTLEVLKAVLIKLPNWFSFDTEIFFFQSPEILLLREETSGILPI